MNNLNYIGFTEEMKKASEEKPVFKCVKNFITWGKKEGLIEVKRPKPIYVGTGKYEVKMKSVKKPGINPLTGNKKNMAVRRVLLTSVDPNKRTPNNVPKYADGKDRVRWQDWLLVKSDPGGMGLGRSMADGKWYGWSHRAMNGFRTRDAAKKFADSVS